MKSCDLRPFVFVCLLSLAACDTESLRPPVLIVREAEDILPLDSPAVQPVYYHNEWDFSMENTAARKKRFIQMVLPAILMARHNLQADRIRVRQILYKLEQSGQVDPSDSTFMARQTERLNASTWEDAYDRLATHPSSIVLAQAAVESGWGSSRFFQEGNNIFGIWSFDPEEDRIPALAAREDGTVFVRSYQTLGESVEDYFITLARHNAYREFRQQRLQEQDPRKLIYALHRYSELGYRYVGKLAMIMRQNDLRRYDRYHLDSTYAIVRERRYF